MKQLISLLSILSLILPPATARAQAVFSARSSGLSGINITLDDVHAVSENPSQITSLKKKVAAMGAEQPFLIRDLHSISFSIILPFRKVHASAFHCSRMGMKEFYVQDYRLSYAISVSPKLNIGVQAERQERIYRAEFARSSSVWIARIGISATPLPGFLIGASISNPTKSKWNNSERSAASSGLRLGGTITLSSKLQMHIQINKSSIHKSQFISGIEYSPVQQLQFRTGMKSDPFSAAFGAGVNWNKTQIDFSTSIQSVIGISPGISIRQNF